MVRYAIALWVVVRLCRHNKAMQSDSVRGVCIVVSLSLNFTTMQTPHTLRLMAALCVIKSAWLFEKIKG